MDENMYVIKKQLQRAKNQLNRDDKLAFPYNNSDTEPMARAKFIKQLRNSETFVPTNKKNDSKTAEPMRATLKKFNGFDYFCIAVFGLATGTLGYTMSKESTQNTKIVQSRFDSSVIAFGLAGLLIGLMIGTINQVALNSSNRDNDIESLYARLSVRIFDLMHETYPELDENVLRACNPEMARVIRALLIANMSDDDVRDINEIAERVAKTLNNMSSLDKNAQNSAKIQCNNDIKRAMAIVENNIAINQNLYSAIYELYRGKVPAQFVFQNNQNTK